MAYGVKIGTLEKKVLRLLAVHPKLHAQAIQRTLNIPDRNYGAVLNACQKLNKKKLLTYENGVSQKKVKVKLWSLTLEDGVNYVLVNNPDFSKEDMKSFIENYSEDLETRRELKKMLQQLGEKLTMRVFATYAKLGRLRTQGKNGLAELMITSIFTAGITREEKAKLEAWMQELLKNRKVNKKVRRYLKKLHLI